jgi:hypothetical protein
MAPTSLVTVFIDKCEGNAGAGTAPESRATVP